MQCEFIILVVCVTLVQISVANVSPSVVEIQDEAIFDLSLMEEYRQVAILQSTKAVQYLFPDVLQDCLTIPGSCNEDAKNLYTRVTCIKSQVIARRMAAFDAISAAMLLVDSEAGYTVPSARNAELSGTTKSAEDTCAARELLITKNSSTIVAKIQAIADRQSSILKSLNAPIFQVIRNNRDMQPRFERTIANTENRSNSELASSLNETFMGFKKLASFGSHATSEEILSTLGTIRNQVLSHLLAHINIIFTFLQTLYSASYIIQLSVVANSSVMHNIHTGVLSESRDTSNNTSLTSANEEPNAVVDIRNTTMASSCDIRAAREIALLQVEMGISAVFNTMINELNGAHPRSESIPENNSCRTETAEEETIDAYRISTDAIMQAVLTANPENYYVVGAAQQAANAWETQVANIIYEAINFIRNSNSSNIQSELQTMEKATSRAAAAAVIQIYVAVRGEKKIEPEVADSLRNAERETIYQFKKSCRGVFAGIRARLTEMFPEHDTETDAYMLSIETAKTRTLLAVRAVVQNIFDSMKILSKHSAGNQHDMHSISSTIRFHREVAMLKVEEATDIIFTNIRSNCTEFSPINENISQRDLSNIDNGRAETSSAYSAALRLIQCAFPTNYSMNFVESKRATFAVLQKAINDVYRGILVGSLKNSSRIPTEDDMQAIEDTATANFRQASLNFYVIIRQTKLYNDAMEPTVSRYQNNALLNADATYSAIFKGIRELRAAISSGCQTGSTDTLSSIRSNHRDASFRLNTLISSKFDTLEYIISASTEKQDEVPDDSCAATIN